MRNQNSHEPQVEAVIPLLFPRKGMIPPSYGKSRLRCCLPVSEDGFIGFAFNTNGEAIRVQIPIDDALRLSSSITEFISQHILHSDISSGSPSSDVSPAEQLNV
jgi:hypothetical protein